MVLRPGSSVLFHVMAALRNEVHITATLIKAPGSSLPPFATTELLPYSLRHYPAVSCCYLQIP